MLLDLKIEDAVLELKSKGCLTILYTRTEFFFIVMAA
jgi:hypothetical protein